MFKDFPQLVPQEVCCSCDGCCRFEDTSTHWRPKVVEEDQVEPLAVDERSYLKATTTEEVCHCTYFNLKTNRCTIYKKRPFECQIYPVLLVEHALGVDVSIHLRCPYIQRSRNTAEFDHYRMQIKVFFEGKEAREFLRRNKQLAGRYEQHRGEIESIFVLGL